jgi:hypothetical protein
MAEMGIKIVLQGGVTETAKNLDAQLKDVNLTPLSIKVNIDSSGLNSTTKATKEVSEATQKAEKEISKYWKSLQNIINEYKKQNIVIDDYIKKLNSARASEDFKQLSDEKQIKIINALTAAENKLAQAQSVARKITALQQKIQTPELTTTKSTTPMINQQISSIDKLIGRYKAGLITYQEFDKYGSKIAQSDNFRSKSLEQQSKLINALSIAEKQRTKILSEDQAIRDKQSSQEQANHSKRLKSLQQEIQLQQQIKAKQISQYSPIGGDKSINLASMERFNNFLKQQNEAYKYGKISAEQYMKITDQLISQTNKYTQADIKLADTIIKNRKAINNATTSTSASTEKTILTIQNLENKLKTMQSGKLGGFLNTQEIANVRTQIDSLRNSLTTMIRPEIANSLTRIRNEMASLAAAARNLSSSSGGGIIKPLDVDKAKNDLIRLEQSMSKIMGSPTWKSSTKAQREEFDKLSGSIRSASLNLGNMSRSDFVNFLRNTKTGINGLNGEIQNADRNSLKLGDSLKQAFLKFPKQNWGLIT